LIFEDSDIFGRRMGCWDLGSFFEKIIIGFHFKEFVLISITFKTEVI
jgi:hypothetical protein